MPRASYQDIPGVDAVLNLPEVEPLVRDWGRLAVRETVRIVQADLRRSIDAGTNSEIDTARLAGEIRSRLTTRGGRGPQPVFNLTGTILHTNLGRALLPEAAIQAIDRTARRPVDLEFSVATGERGQRDVHLVHLLRDLTGAESATVVNNNAAAVMLILNTLALDLEVPVSRGELIEIGGSFRIPDIMRQAGCRLREIGTTNRTHRSDYTRAMNQDTALLLKIHPSNYVIEGFTAEVSEPDLASLAKSSGVPFVVDLGSGALVDLAAYGLPAEPTPMATLKNGADLVCFSGDKLLGGPQAGIIVGSKALIEKLNANPMKRALRLDKLTIAALAEVLKLYTEPDRLATELPVMRSLTRPLDEIEALAHRIAPAVANQLPGFQVTAAGLHSQVGSGALPQRKIPSAGLRIAIDADPDAGGHLKRLAHALRALPRPVIGRFEEGCFWLDLRCLDDETEFVAQLGQLTFTKT